MSVLKKIDFLGNTPRRKAIYIGKYDFIDLFQEVEHKHYYSDGSFSYDLFFEAEGKFYLLKFIYKEDIRQMTVLMNKKSNKFYCPLDEYHIRSLKRKHEDLVGIIHPDLKEEKTFLDYFVSHPSIRLRTIFQ